MSAATPAIVHPIATTGVTIGTCTRNVARNNAGSVTMSPAAVTIGAATLSRSHPRRTLSAATPTVIPSTTIDDSTPPITEITTKSATEIVFSRPNPMQMAFARNASASEIEIDNATDAARF